MAAKIFVLQASLHNTRTSGDSLDLESATEHFICTLGVQINTTTTMWGSLTLGSNQGYYVLALPVGSHMFMVIHCNLQCLGFRKGNRKIPA